MLARSRVAVFGLKDERQRRVRVVAGFIFQF